MNRVSNTYSLLAHCVCVFLRWSRQIPIVSLSNINRLNFVKERQCVYCEVGTINPTTWLKNSEDMNVKEQRCENLNPYP
jgi:hypothetical protein